MNVAAHQEKEKNKRTSKRKAGEERRHADFKEAVCYPSAIVHGAARKKMVCVRGVTGVIGTRGKANSHFNPTQTGLGAALPRLRRLLIGAVDFARFRCIYYIYDRNFALHCPKRSESIRVFGTDRKSVIMIRVKVN